LGLLAPLPICQPRPYLQYPLRGPGVHDPKSSDPRWRGHNVRNVFFLLLSILLKVM
jgi:hypothetical protein